MVRTLKTPLLNFVPRLDATLAATILVVLNAIYLLALEKKHPEVQGVEETLQQFRSRLIVASYPPGQILTGPNGRRRRR